MPSPAAISYFRAKILSWFKKNKRSYPWREAEDPFRVLIAEMMLRRTKADQVKPVYDSLFKEYPDVEKLAGAENEKIEKIVYSLGLRWRTPSFGLVARELRERYHCRVPDNREELKKLTGVGDYVAGAVLSFGYGKREWIVDNNIVRLFQRYFGIKTSREGRRDKHVIEMAKRYVLCRNPKKANYAILDFTALVCKPRNPECEKCPLKKDCIHVTSKVSFIKNF